MSDNFEKTALTLLALMLAVSTTILIFLIERAAQ